MCVAHGTGWAFVWEVIVVSEPDGLGLADALEVLREQLAEAQLKAAAAAVQFPIESLTIELKVAVTKLGEGRAGFKVPFVGAELGGSASYSREALQTLTVVLAAPVDRNGNPIKVTRATDEEKE
jgi:hypothetical protein